MLVELPAICRKPEADGSARGPAPGALGGPLPREARAARPPGRLAAAGAAVLPRPAGAHRPAGARAERRRRPSVVRARRSSRRSASESLRPLARVARESVTARDAAHAFLRELLREVKRATGHRVRDLVVTSPVTAFETYRAEVQQASCASWACAGSASSTSRWRRRSATGSASARSARCSSWTSAAARCTWCSSASRRRGADRRPGDGAGQARAAAGRQRRRRLGAAGPLPRDGPRPRRPRTTTR